MYRPFKTTVKFKSDDGREVRLRYLVSADNSIEANCELERRFLNREVFGYKIETIVAATSEEAAIFKLTAPSFACSWSS
jgi:hypothetical protein